MITLIITMFVEILDLFNDLNEIDFFMTILKRKENVLFNREFNVFFNIDFLNWFEFYVNDKSWLNKLISLIKTKFEVKQKLNKFFEKSINVLKASKWLQRSNSKIM